MNILQELGMREEQWMLDEYGLRQSGVRAVRNIRRYCSGAFALIAEKNHLPEGGTKVWQYYRLWE